MLTSIISLFKWILWIYYWYFLILASTLATLTFAYRMSKVGTRINYWLCHAILIIGFWWIPGLLLPIFAARPRHWQNGLIMGWHLRKLSYLTGFTWEIRGVKHAEEDSGAIICCNHQSAFDIFGDLNTGNVFKKRGIVSKKSLIFLFPIGFASLLSNVVFIDRSNPSQIKKSLKIMDTYLIEKKMKFMMYPEGTRSGDYGFLPFKKGAFVSAIRAQVPVIPMVFSPYYFKDHKRGVFLYEKKHTIITVLEPISTKGMTEDDVESLKQKTYDVMFEEYKKLHEEVTKNSQNPEWVNQKRPRCTSLYH